MTFAKFGETAREVGAKATGFNDGDRKFHLMLRTSGRLFLWGIADG